MPGHEGAATWPRHHAVVARRTRRRDADRLFGHQGRHHRDGAAPGRSSSRRTASRSTRWRRVRSAPPRCFIRVIPAGSRAGKCVGALDSDGAPRHAAGCRQCGAVLRQPEFQLRDRPDTLCLRRLERRHRSGLNRHCNAHLLAKLRRCDRRARPIWRKLAAYLNEIAAPGTSVHVEGISPPDRDFGRLSELRCAVQAIDNGIAAQESGFDAYVMGHFQDPGLYELRSALTIPVIGAGEATLLAASQLGRRLGLVTLDAAFEVWHYEQADRYGLGGRVDARDRHGLPAGGFQRGLRGRRDRARHACSNDFTACAQPLVDAGADVIIPAGVLPGLAGLRRAWLQGRTCAGGELRRGGAEIRRDVGAVAPPQRHRAEPRSELRAGTDRRHATISARWSRAQQPPTRERIPGQPRGHMMNA